ncbi:hypothetical protein [Rufibacter sp. LB8]|uniref:hypothetical protein n=1 Tax=Rufibacter sp. LB8 TaxID=2777781 RepID=UPI00178C234B|nr:hypothetical protein [Rufibacter sp. LB8]
MKTLSKFLLFAFLIFSISCTQDTDQPTFISVDQKVEQAVKAQYNISKFNIEATPNQLKSILESAKEQSKYFQQFKEKLDYSNVRLFTNDKDNITIAMINFKGTDKKILVLKGAFSNSGFQVVENFLIGYLLHDGKNGKIMLLNGKEGLTIDIENGVNKIRPILEEDGKLSIIKVDDSEGRHGGDGFCQRESGETYAKCFEEESKEFCDSFVSCVYFLNPIVVTVVAASCNCSAVRHLPQ